jgi:hypothetical protein
LTYCTLFSARRTLFSAAAPFSRQPHPFLGSRTLFSARRTLFSATDPFLGTPKPFLGVPNPFLGTPKPFLGAPDPFLGTHFCVLRKSKLRKRKRTSPNSVEFPPKNNYLKRNSERNKKIIRASRNAHQACRPLTFSFGDEENRMIAHARVLTSFFSFSRHFTTCS